MYIKLVGSNSVQPWRLFYNTHKAPCITFGPSRLTTLYCNEQWTTSSFLHLGLLNGNKTMAIHLQSWPILFFNWEESESITSQQKNDTLDTIKLANVKIPKTNIFLTALRSFKFLTTLSQSLSLGPINKQKVVLGLIEVGLNFKIKKILELLSLSMEVSHQSHVGCRGRRSIMQEIIMFPNLFWFERPYIIVKWECGTKLMSKF